MNDKRQLEQPVAINLGDIYFVLFRHKWKIIICSLLGIFGAVAYNALKPSPYQSMAVLSVESSMDKRMLALNQKDAKAAPVTALSGETLVNTEMELLGSFNVIDQVVSNLTAPRILAKLGGGNDPLKAAFYIKVNLVLDHPKLSTVIHVTFTHPDPLLAREILRNVLDEYMKANASMHRNAEGYDNFLMGKTSNLKKKLTDIEQQLMAVKTNAGVFFLDEDKRATLDQAAKNQAEIYLVEAEMEEHKAALEGWSKLAASKQETNQAATATGDTNLVGSTAVATNLAAVKPAATNPPAATDPFLGIPPAKVREYNQARNTLDQLWKNREVQLNVYPEESKVVKAVTARIEEAKNRVELLEKEYPKLPGLGMKLPPAPTSPVPGLTGPTYTTTTRVPMTTAQFDPEVEGMKVAALKRKIQVLYEQRQKIEARATNIAGIEPAILELQRSKTQAEEAYRVFLNAFEQSRTEGELEANDLSRIPVLQDPTMAARDTSKALKISIVLVCGGIFGSLAWAFLVDFVLDRSVKRPKDVERGLGFPLFMSLPDVGRRAMLAIPATVSPTRLQLPAAEGGAPAEGGNGSASGPDAEAAVAPGAGNHALTAFYDALRDRLVGYFDARSLTHKPKLVAVTGARRGAGTSTIATGLAASLSATGEGNVLLVDMNSENGSAQKFFKGQAECGLAEALEDDTRDTAFVHKNFYVASGGGNHDKLPKVLPKRFASLLPKFKASNYDYIIFDMPPVGQTTITARLAGYMDMVLLVIESEKTDRELVQRATGMLAESKANVSHVLNKTRKYVPNVLQPEA